jgi:hypothetical protein
MTYYPDLSRYEYHQHMPPNSLNVGWLDDTHPFPKGIVHPRLLELLRKRVANPNVQAFGLHSCELCPLGTIQPRVSIADRVVRLGCGELVFDSREGVSYVAPDMIVHYIIDHEYLPPRRFLAALLESFSEEERAAILNADQSQSDHHKPPPLLLDPKWPYAMFVGGGDERRRAWNEAWARRPDAARLAAPRQDR